MGFGGRAKGFWKKWGGLILGLAGGALVGSAIPGLGLMGGAQLGMGAMGGFGGSGRADKAANDAHAWESDPASALAKGMQKRKVQRAAGEGVANYNTFQGVGGDTHEVA